MNPKGKGFLEEIRSLDEKRKRNVLIVASLLAMALIVFVWAQYFNAILMAPATDSSVHAAALGADAATAPAFNSIPTANPSLPANDQTSQAPTSSGASNQGFWHGLINGISGLGQIFTGGTQYIQPSQ